MVKLIIMRLFVAIDVPKQIRIKVSEVMNKLKSIGIDVKFTEPENLHFTMKFLGEVHGSEGGEDRVKDIQERISSALSNFKPFHISVEGLGYFGKPSYIKTLWIDTASPGREELVKMAKALNDNLSNIWNFRVRA